MLKTILAFGFFILSNLSFADNNIVYLDQNLLQQKSVALSNQQKKIATQYEAKLGKLQAQQNVYNSKISQATSDTKAAAQLSAKLLQLQQQMNNLEAERDTKIKQVLTQYFAVEREVLKKILADKHYSYILNINAIYMTESVNDVTPSVLKLTDTAYEQKYSH